MGGLDVNKRDRYAEESVMTESGSGTGRTWSVLLLHYSHTSPMGATHFIPVLIDTKKLEQRHLESLEPATRMLSYLSQS